MNSTFSRIAILTGTVFAAALATVPARAADDAPRAILNVQGIDLTTADGLASARGKARHVAQKMCISDERVDLATLTNERKCYRHAIADADSQIDRMRAFAALRRANSYAAVQDDSGRADRPAK